MKRLAAVLCICALAAMAGAQTVTVDNTNGAPDNVSTFSEIQVAINSFQASGAVSAGTDGGGIGVNHGNAAPNVIQIVATGTVYRELIRIDERSGQLGYSVQDEDFEIIGVPSGENAKPVIAPIDDSGTAADGDGFEIRTDVNFAVRNCVFVWDINFPDGGLGANMITIDRLTTTSGTPSTFVFEDCVFTGPDASGDAIVTNEDEAYINRRSEITDGAGGTAGYTVGFFPDVNEGMVGTFTNCVWSHTSNHSLSRHRGLFLFFNGTGTAWTEEVGVTVDGGVFTYNPGVGIEMQSGGNGTDASLQYVNITGSGAKADGVANGNPTVIAFNGNDELPNNGTALFFFETNTASAYSGAIDNLWCVGNTGPVLATDVFAIGFNGYFDWDDCLFVGNNATGTNTSTFSVGWQADPGGIANIPGTMTMTDTTIVANTTDALGGTALNFLNYPAAKTMNLSNVIIAASNGAAGPITGIANSGSTVVNVADSLIATAGLNAVTTDVNNSGAGAINQAGILNVDPQLVTNADIAEANYYVALNQSLKDARPGPADLDGGRIIGDPPTSAQTWDMYK